MDRQESRMASLLPKNVAGLRGAAWVATLALACSGYYATRAWPGRVVHDLNHLLAFLPFLLVLVGLGLTYSRRSIAGWATVLILSAIGTLLMFSTSSWGQGIMDAPRGPTIRYQSYTFAGDAMLAFGFVVLLGVSVAALFVDLIAKSEG